jgi:hypothetical protein
MTSCLASHIPLLEKAHLSKLAFASGGGHNRKYHIQQVWSLGGFGPIVIWTDA